MESGMRFTFRCETNYKGQPKVINLVTTDAEELDDVLEVFQDFLKGCSFYIDGNLNIVDEK